MTHVIPVQQVAPVTPTATMSVPVKQAITRTYLLSVVLTAMGVQPGEVFQALEVQGSDPTSSTVILNTLQ